MSIARLIFSPAEYCKVRRRRNKIRGIHDGRLVHTIKERQISIVEHFVCHVSNSKEKKIRSLGNHYHARVINSVIERERDGRQHIDSEMALRQM
jgi:hypothetical protein